MLTAHRAHGGWDSRGLTGLLRKGQDILSVEVVLGRGHHLASWLPGGVCNPEPVAELLWDSVSSSPKRWPYWYLRTVPWQGRSTDVWKALSPHALPRQRHETTASTPCSVATSVFGTWMSQGPQTLATKAPGHPLSTAYFAVYYTLRGMGLQDGGRPRPKRSNPITGSPALLFADFITTGVHARLRCPTQTAVITTWTAALSDRGPPTLGPELVPGG